MGLHCGSAQDLRACRQPSICASAAREPLVLSAGDHLLRKAERVDNYLGMPGLTGGEMMDRFTDHARQLGVEVRLAQVGNVMPLGDTFSVNAGGEILTARSVILACGVSKARAVPGEEEFLGRGVPTALPVTECFTGTGMWPCGALGPTRPEEADFLASIGCRVHYVAAKSLHLADGIPFLEGRLKQWKAAKPWNAFASAVRLCP